MKSAPKAQAGTEQKSPLLSIVENLDGALARLETAIDKRLSSERKHKEEPQLDLARNDREINKKVAARLDQTINRLETILSTQ